MDRRVCAFLITLQYPWLPGGDMNRLFESEMEFYAEKFNCVGIFFSASLWDKAFADTVIMLHGWANVPTIFAVKAPRRTLLRLEI